MASVLGHCTVTSRRHYSADKLFDLPYHVSSELRTYGRKFHAQLDQGCTGIRSQNHIEILQVDGKVVLRIRSMLPDTDAGPGTGLPGFGAAPASLSLYRTPLSANARHPSSTTSPRRRRRLRLLTLLISVLFILVYWTLIPRSSISRNTATMGSAVESPLRLAILEADTPQPTTKAKYGGYGGVFTALLTAAGRALDPPQELDQLVTITAHDVVNDLNSYPSLDDVDALLITGSRHTAFDDDEWIKKLVSFTKAAVDSGRVRVVGVCFGHQIVGRAMGAKLGKSDKGWEVAVTDVDLTEEGKKVFQMDKMVRIFRPVIVRPSS